MNKVFRWIFIVLGSVWFFPVSCTTGTVAGYNLAAILDARDASRGDEMHYAFSVAVEDEGGYRLMRLQDVEEWQQLRAEAPDEYPPLDFLLPPPKDQKKPPGIVYTRYAILEQTPQEQLVEVVDSDDDRTVWSRYRATANGVTPVSSRMQYVGYAFTGFFWGFIGAFGLYLFGVVGRWLMRKRQTARDAFVLSVDD